MADSNTQTNLPPPTQQNVQGYTLQTQTSPTGQQTTTIVNPGYLPGSQQLLDYYQSAINAATRTAGELAYGAGQISTQQLQSQNLGSTLQNIGVSIYANPLAAAALDALAAYSRLGSSAQASGGGTGTYTSQQQAASASFWANPANTPQGREAAAMANVAPSQSYNIITSTTRGAGADWTPALVTGSGQTTPLSSFTPSQLNSLVSSATSAAAAGAPSASGLLNVYVPFGSFRQTQIENAKLAVNPISSEYAVYQQLPSGRMVVNPDTGKLENFILIGGGGVGAAAAGTTSLAALTPAVLSQEGQYITPKFSAYTGNLGAGDIISAIERGTAMSELSRLGAEAYGGIVSRLDNRTLGGITYESYKYPAAQGNIADLTYRPGVNVAQGYLSNIPWSVGSEATNLMSLGPQGVENVTNIPTTVGAVSTPLGFANAFTGKFEALPTLAPPTSTVSSSIAPAVYTPPSPSATPSGGGIFQDIFNVVAQQSPVLGVLTGRIKLTNEPYTLEKAAADLERTTGAPGGIAGYITPGFGGSLKVAEIGTKELAAFGGGALALAFGGKAYEALGSPDIIQSVTDFYKVPPVNLPVSGGKEGPAINDVLKVPLISDVPPSVPVYAPPVGGTTGPTTNLPAPVLGGGVLEASAALAAPLVSGIGQGIAGFYPSVIQLPKTSITSEDITGFVAPVLPTLKEGYAAIEDTNFLSRSNLIKATGLAATQMAAQAKTGWANVLQTTETNAVSNALLEGFGAAAIGTAAYNSLAGNLAFPTTTNTFAPVTEAISQPATLSSTVTNPAAQSIYNPYVPSYYTISGPSSRTGGKQDLKFDFKLPTFGGTGGGAGKKGRFGRFTEQLVGIKFNVKGFPKPTLGKKMKTPSFTMPTGKKKKK